MNRLSRHIAKLILAGMILTVGGCAYDDTVRDLREQKADSESLAISFSNGIIDNPLPMLTRAVSDNAQRPYGDYGRLGVANHIRGSY